MLSSSVVRLTFGIALTVLLTTLPAAAAQPRPGTYTDYPFDQAGLPNTFTRYDMFVTWESAPLRGAIYPAFTFGFEGGGGYMGTQLDGIDHRILFSIWDSPGGASVVPGPGCSRFGGEGTGGHCGAHYPWVEGREYRLRVLKTGTSADGDDWTGSIADTVTGVETAVGTLHVLNTAPYHGYGQLKKGASTFTEYFGGPEGCDSQPHARIRWRGPYADPSMWLPSAAIVSENVGYPCLTHNNQTSPGAPVVEVETGGAGTPVTNPQGANLWAPSSCSYPFTLANGRIQVANAACFDPSLSAPATTTTDIADYSTWTYPSGGSVQSTASAVANGTDFWAVFYKGANFTGDSFCLGPHRFAELFHYAGWNDVLASHHILASGNPCVPPPGCTVELPGCGDGAVESECGEQCDGGPGGGGGCCDATCRLLPAGSSCEDGDVCTHGDVCDAAGACNAQSGCGDGVVDSLCEECDPGVTGQCCDSQCRGEATTVSCDDDDACTHADVCDGRSGQCFGTSDPSSSCGGGLRGEYFDNSDLTDSKLVRTDPRIDFDWSDGSPDPVIADDTFSVRWTGSIQPRYSETYTFYATADDGVRLWVDDRLLVDRWIDQAPTEASGTIALQAGRKVPIRMEYYEDAGGAVAKLAWSSASQPKETVPQSALFSGCGDGVLDPTHEQCDDGNLDPHDGCEPDCTLSSVGDGCAPIKSAKLTLSNLGGSNGDETVSLSGKIAFISGTPAGFDPLDTLHRGAQILLEDLGSNGAPFFELSHRTHPVPAGARAAVCSPSVRDGWTANGAQTTYTYTNGTGKLPAASCAAGSAAGLRTLKLVDKRRTAAHAIEIDANAAHASIAAAPVGPVRITVALSANASESLAGACGQVTLSKCLPGAGGRSLLCR